MKQEAKVLLQIDHMRKSFDGFGVLKDISLCVREGEVVSIIGPSGSGKSTLLRCATMLEQMDGGTLCYLGEQAAHEENGKCVYASKAQLREIRKHFGLVFQNFNLFPHYSVMKNIIDAPVNVDHVPKKEAVLRAEKLLGQLGLSDKADAYPYQLSGGQQQRVSIARALARKPEILIFDDSFSALDYKTDACLREGLARELGETTCLIVAQRIGTIRHADLIVVLDEGRVAGMGTHRELLQNCGIYREIAESQLSPEELERDMAHQSAEKATVDAERREEA